MRRNPADRPGAVGWRSSAALARGRTCSGIPNSALPAPRGHSQSDPLRRQAARFGMSLAAARFGVQVALGTFAPGFDVRVLGSAARSRSPLREAVLEVLNANPFQCTAASFRPAGSATDDARAPRGARRIRPRPADLNTPTPLGPRCQPDCHPASDAVSPGVWVPAAGQSSVLSWHRSAHCPGVGSG